MKFAVHVSAPLIAGLPAESMCIFEYCVVSPRNSGTWKVPWMSRTPLSSAIEVTVNDGA